MNKVVNDETSNLIILNQYIKDLSYENFQKVLEQRVQSYQKKQRVQSYQKNISNQIVGNITK